MLVGAATNDAHERAALLWLERALERPRAQRRRWLREQQLPIALEYRVIALLDAENALDRFLDAAGAAPTRAGAALLRFRWGAFALILAAGLVVSVGLRECTQARSDRPAVLRPPEGQAGPAAGS